MKKALISVSDKKGVLEFAGGLANLGFEILSTGGTAKLLREQGLKVVEVGDYTGQKEIMDGRLKTLHPKILGGILAMRSNPKHVREIRESGIEPIDLIVVNLYPFEETVSKQMRGIGGRAVSPPDFSSGSGLASPELMAHAIENIDIGGPTMIRAAAKNWQDVAVVVDLEDYPAVLDELKKNKGEVSKETKFRLAQKVFILTSRYDGAIANYLTGGKDAAFPDTFNYQGRKIQELRYGENPHQKAAFYLDAAGAGGEPCIATARQVHGKELSYNNIMDLDAALEAVKEFVEPTVVIIKHATPCGVARAALEGDSLRQIFTNARDCDPTSAFGGIIAINVKIDPPTASEIGKDFYECVVAPAYDPKALEILKAKKNIRLMEIPGWEEWGRLRSAAWSGVPALRKVTGGLLLQDRDLFQCDVRKARVATKRAPTEAEWQAMEFAWKVVKHVKSNAIVYATADRTIGIGGGQVSRVDATKIGISKARSALQGAVMASDAFFPFRDNIDEAAKAGTRAVIQPGGSLRDEESIQACDERDLAMVFTGVRHFRH